MTKHIEVEPPAEISVKPRTPAHPAGDAQLIDIPQTEEKQKKQKQTENTQDKEVAGYGLADIAKAPVEPPEPSHIDTEEETSNRKVKLLVFSGIALIVIGILFGFAISVIIGAIVVAIGTSMVVTSVFAPIT